MTRLDLSVGEELSRSFEPCLRHLSKKVALRANMLLEGRLTMAVSDVSNPEQFNQLDWKMLQHGAVSLYNDHTVLTEDCTWFGERHYHVHQFDCVSWQKIDDFYTAINQELDWPFPYNNLDALEELLVDMHVPQESGTLFVFWRFDTCGGVSLAMRIRCWISWSKHQEGSCSRVSGLWSWYTRMIRIWHSTR
jgi:hypothetical protein